MLKRAFFPVMPVTVMAPVWNHHNRQVDRCSASQWLDFNVLSCQLHRVASGQSNSAISKFTFHNVNLFSFQDSSKHWTRKHSSTTHTHAYTLRMWLCMKWHGAWLYGVHRTCAEMAAVSCGTSHASAIRTPLRWIFKKTRYKASHSCRTTCERSESAQESGE